MATTIDDVHQLQIRNAKNGDFDLNLADESARNQIEDLTEDLGVQTARIDNLLTQGTPTEGNAELIDIRVGADGTIYPTAGDAVRGQVTELKGEINGATSINYIDGYNLDGSGGTVAQEGVSVSEKIPYTWTGSTRYYCHDTTQTIYKIAFYDSSDNLLAIYQNPSSAGGVEYRSINAENVVSGTISYVRFSFKTGTTGEVRKNVSPNYELLWESKTTYVKGLAERINALEDSQIVIYSNTIKKTESVLSNETITALESVDTRKNMDIDFRADITSFTSVTVGHGYMINYGAWAVVDDTNVTIYASQNGDQIGQYAHGLTIGHYIHVLIQQGDNTKATLVIETASGRFRQENVTFDSRRGNFYATVNGTFTNVSLTAVLKDLNKSIWMFGDSYQSIGDSKRYPYYLSQDVYIGNCLMSGFPGASADHQIISFRNLINIAKPKYVVWCMGMNGSDSTTAVNSNWKTYTDEVISTCEAKGVIPILATIPNVPDRIQTFKNAYVKSLDYRYIDFAKAVGAEAQGSSWYTGMLSTDNLHPTETGAIALYSELLADFPEIME